MVVKKYEVIEFIEDCLSDLVFQEHMIIVDIQKDDGGSLIVDFQEIEDGTIVSSKYKINVELIIK